MEQKRNDSIDFVKGVLIIFVILGHIVLGTISENLIRGVIYSFHMPLFLFVSGYMINLDRLMSQSFNDLFSKYWDRMLKAWLVAYVIFTAYHVLSEPSLRQVIGLLYSPWGHLWYVPTLFCYVLMSKFLFGKFNVKVSYLVLILLNVAWNVLIQVSSIHLSHWCDCSKLLYFALGLFMKNHFVSSRFLRSYTAVPLFYVPLFLALQHLPFKIRGVVLVLLLFGVIFLYLYPAIVKDMMPKSKVFTFIGKNSLYIYLWHQAPILLLVDFVSTKNLTYYYVISFALLVLFLLVVKWRVHCLIVK